MNIEFVHNRDIMGQHLLNIAGYSIVWNFITNRAGSIEAVINGTVFHQTHRNSVIRELTNIFANPEHKKIFLAQPDIQPIASRINTELGASDLAVKLVARSQMDSFTSTDKLKGSFGTFTPGLFYVLEGLHNYKYLPDLYYTPLRVQGASMAFQLQKLTEESLSLVANHIGAITNQDTKDANNVIIDMIAFAEKTPSALTYLQDLTGKLKSLKGPITVRFSST